MSLCLQHNKLFLKSSVCFSAYYSKWIPVRTKKPNKRFLCVHILFQVAWKILALLSVFSVVRNGKGKALTFKQYSSGTDPCQQLVLALPVHHCVILPVVTGHIYVGSLSALPLQSISVLGNQGRGQDGREESGYEAQG